MHSTGPRTHLLPSRQISLVVHVASMAAFAVALDVDGVLYRGSARDPVPGAAAVVQRLWRGGRVAVPHVFITNGTGYTETGKVGPRRTHGTAWLG
jgi:hypothetical protein